MLCVRDASETSERQERKGDGTCLWEAEECHSGTQWRGMNCGKVHGAGAPLRSSDSQNGSGNETLDGKNKDQGRQFRCKSEQLALLPLARRGIAPPSQESSLDVL